METRYSGLEEIEYLPPYLVSEVDENGDCYGVKPRYRSEELAWEKINEIVEKVNILMKLKNDEVRRGRG